MIDAIKGKEVLMAIWFLEEITLIGTSHHAKRQITSSINTFKCRHNTNKRQEQINSDGDQR
jgi:hypothetical protein